VGLRAGLKTELPHIAGGGDDQSELQWKGKLLLGKNNNSSDHIAETGSESPAQCTVDRRNQILHTRPLFEETTSEFLLVTDVS
jgi:hypothetical protein